MKGIKHMALFSEYPKHTVKKAREMGHKYRIEKVTAPEPFRYLFYTLDRDSADTE